MLLTFNAYIIRIIIPDAQRAQQHLYMGVRVGISAKYRTRSTPLYFLCPDCGVQSRLELYTYWSSFAIQCQAQTDERDKWLDR